MSPAVASSEGPGEVFARLLLAAKEDASFRVSLVKLLALPAIHRDALIKTALQEMALKGEPADLRDGFAALLQPGAPAAVLSYLSGK